jgi:hypothetical protein
MQGSIITFKFTALSAVSIIHGLFPPTLESGRVFNQGSITKYVIINSPQQRLLKVSLLRIWLLLKVSKVWRFHPPYNPHYTVFQKESYNFESLYKFIQKTCTVFWTIKA